MITLKKGGSLLLLALLSWSSRQVQAAPAPYAIDVKELDQLERKKPAASPAPKAEPAQKTPGSFDLNLKELDRRKPAAPKPEKKKAAKSKKKPSALAGSEKARQTPAEGAEYLRYTVKPGDHIFKILMGPFGMSNEAAERLLPEVLRINKIDNIKQLRVGQTLLIPRKGDALGGKAAGDQAKTAAASAPAPVVVAPAPAAPPRETVAPAHVPAAPAPVAAPAPAPVAPRAPEPRAPEPRAPESAPIAAAHRQMPVPPAVPAAVTWVCSVTEREPARMVDAVLNALSVPWSKNKIVQSSDGAATAFSIRVDRYFEYKGARYIVSIGEKDAYSYTLLRILESAGYRVLRVGGAEDFKTVGEKLLAPMGVAPEFAKHPLQEGNEAAGFLVQPDDAGGKRVVLTGEPVDARQKWVMKPGCAAK